MPTPSSLLQAVLLVGAMLWCGDVLRRLPHDVAELRAGTDGAARAALWVVWALTGGVAVWALGVAWRIGAGLMAWL